DGLPRVLRTLRARTASRRRRRPCNDQLAPTGRRRLISGGTCSRRTAPVGGSAMPTTPDSLPGRRLAGLACALMLIGTGSGCSFLRAPGDGGRTETGWKMVMEKVPPAYLVAVDRSECTVSAERYEKTREGDNVFCVWRVPSIAGEDPRSGPPWAEPDRTPRPDVPPDASPRRAGGTEARASQRHPGQP